VKELYVHATQKGYTQTINTELGEIKEEKKRKVKRKNGTATLSDLYPSTCLTWEALLGV